MRKEVVWKFRKQIPEAHRTSLDTRLQWLWHQRFRTVQRILNESPDVLDKLASTVVLQAIMAVDLNSIMMLFQRLEGGPVTDVTLSEMTLRI